MSHSSLETITHFYALSENVGTAGQPQREQFAWIKDAGYQVVINLAMESAEYGVPDEQAIVKALGLTYIAIPVVWQAPQPSDFERFVQVMQANQHQKVFVHCAMNFRVSSFMFLYRSRHLGIPREQAWHDMLWIWSPNPIWKKFIEEMEART